MGLIRRLKEGYQQGKEEAEREIQERAEREAREREAEQKKPETPSRIAREVGKTVHLVKPKVEKIRREASVTAQKVQKVARKIQKAREQAGRDLQEMSRRMERMGGGLDSMLDQFSFSPAVRKPSVRRVPVQEDPFSLGSVGGLDLGVTPAAPEPARHRSSRKRKKTRRPPQGGSGVTGVGGFDLF